MTKKVRYSLILIGCIFFLIAAPIIVLYVRGIGYNFTTGQFFKTGILAVRIEPKNADIFLNGKLKRTSSGDLRFLPPGEYQLTIQKDGYQTWSKRMSVFNGQVTWANPLNNNIYLLYSQPNSKILASDVKDFNPGNNPVYLTADKIFVNGNSYNLPQPVNQILTADGSGKNFIVISTTTNQSFYFNSDSGKFIDISKLSPQSSNLNFDSSGNLYTLNNQTLYKLNPALQNKTQLLQNIKTFTFQDNTLYYLQQSTSTLSLFYSNAPYNQGQLLLNNIPDFSQAQLLLTSGKQILLLADGSLYQVASALQKIAENVSEANVNSGSSEINIFHAGEFDYWDSFNQTLSLVTRSGETLTNLQTRNNIDYAFYINNNQLNAIELDSRDRQNQYILYSGTNLTKFTIDNQGQNILLLDAGKLISLKIR